jgi:translation initiation factor 1
LPKLGAFGKLAPPMKDGKLVYSTDPTQMRICPKCKELVSSCICPPKVELKSFNFVAILRIEKTGRSGKTVTVIDGLPKVNVFLKDLTKKLKNKCGSGGTYLMDGKEGRIEIQGDKRELIRTLLAQEKIKTKG